MAPVHLTCPQWAEWQLHIIGGSEITVSPVIDLSDVTQMADIHLLDEPVVWLSCGC